MKTFVLEGTCMALSSISHNGGEKNGTIVQLRREKFVQPKGNVVEIPIISGNSIRGKLRDLSAIDILTKKDGVKVEVDADPFNLLFSGGSLESTGGKNLDIEKVRQMRKDIPMISVLGCAVGNIIVPGKVDIGKLIPICKETLHLIPEKFHGTEEIKTIWEYCQVEMNTRKDDTKDENKREFIKKEALTEDLRGGQMMYHIETLIAGTRFYWKVCLRDTTDIETGAFLSIIQSWAAQSSQVGGNGRVGHGCLKIELTETSVVDSEMKFENSDFVTYIDKANKAKKDVTNYFEKGVSKTLFSDNITIPNETLFFKKWKNELKKLGVENHVTQQEANVIENFVKKHGKTIQEVHILWSSYSDSLGATWLGGITYENLEKLI